MCQNLIHPNKYVVQTTALLPGTHLLSIERGMISLLIAAPSWPATASADSYKKIPCESQGLPFWRPRPTTAPEKDAAIGGARWPAPFDCCNSDGTHSSWTYDTRSSWPENDAALARRPAPFDACRSSPQPCRPASQESSSHVSRGSFRKIDWLLQFFLAADRGPAFAPAPMGFPARTASPPTAGRRPEPLSPLLFQLDSSCERPKLSSSMPPAFRKIAWELQTFSPAALGLPPPSTSSSGAARAAAAGRRGLRLRAPWPLQLRIVEDHNWTVQGQAPRAAKSGTDEWPVTRRPVAERCCT
mmetsp:Transcript_6729/g.19029  ORF Transcript_6729/g.19029 Transcript_6729/m.19029 type:complete len:300 (+) Transcript_6729:16-915(+)